MIPAVAPVLNTSDLQRRYDMALAAMHGEFMRALERTVTLAAQYARLGAGDNYEGWSPKFNSQTGALRASVRTFVTGGPTMGYVGSVIADAPHARFVEFGTKAHIIQGRFDGASGRPKMLRFEVGGTVIFRRSVMHPGTHPRPFMRGAQLKTQPFFEDMIAEAFVRAFM